MAKEIERKFLVIGSEFKEAAFRHETIIQGYISTNPDATVRVRIKGDHAFLTVKTRNDGCVRNEWEFAVNKSDAEEMLQKCAGNIIEKTRWYVNAVSAEAKALVWEIDEFEGRLAGLVVAEIELPKPETPFEKPIFIGEEVTGNPAYYNSSLAAR